MTRKKSNVKALALAVTCAILAGGGIGLKPVYAADVTYDVGSNQLKNGTTAIDTLTVGGVTIGGIGTGYGITIGDVNKHVMISDHDISATGSVHASIISSGINARMSDGKVVAQNGLYIGYDGTDITKATYDNSRFAVNGENGSFKAANGKFTVSGGGAITADSLTLGNNYNVKQNIEDAKGRITTVEGDLNTNKAGINTLNGRVDAHDTDINALKTKTKDIKYENDGSTTVDGVNFNGGAVSGVTSINNTNVGGVTLSDGTIEAASGKFKVYNNGAMDASGGAFKVSSAGTIKALGIQTHSNGSITLNDKLFLNAEDASLQDRSAGKAVSVAEMASTRDNTQKISYNNADGTKIDGNVIINKEQKNQVKITKEEGIVVGLNSSVINDDGVFAGGHDYGSAKAALNASDGSIKGANGKFAVDENGAVSAADGAFGVDKDGNVKTDGNIQGNNITATGVLKGKTLGIGTNGTEFTVNADGEVQAAGGKVSIDKTGKATFGYTAGNITTIEGQKITTGSIVATDTTVASNISGVQMLDGKITASNMEITGAISLNDLTVNNKLNVGAFSVDKNGVVAGVQSINGANVTESGTGLTIGSATVGAANPFSSTGFTVDANGNVAAQNITAGTYNGNTIGADNKFNGVELKGGDVKATKVTADTITDGTAIMTGGTVTANTITANTSASLAGVTFDASGVDFNGKDIKNVANVTATNVTATTAKLGNLSIAGHVIKNEVDAGGPIGLGTTVTVNNAGELGGITKIDGVNVTDDAGGLAIGTGATQVTIGGANAISVGAGTFTVDSAGLVTGNQFTTTNGSYLKDNELKLNDANIWNTTEGLKAEKAVIGANTLDTAGISTTGTLSVEGVATFGKDAADQTKITQGKAEFTQGGKTTTIKGGEIETDKLTVNDIVLKNSMKDGAGNTITIKGSDGSMSVAGGKFAVDDKGQMTNEYTGYGAAGRTTKTTLKTSVDGINANYTNSVNNNNNLLNINQDGVALGVTDSSNNNLGMLSADAEKATMGYGTANSIVVDKNTIKSALGTDVTRVMTNSTTEQSIVDKVGAASRSLKADEIVDVAGGMTITTNNTGTTFSDGTTNTLIKGSAITSTNGTATGVLDGSNLTLTNGANKTVLDAGKVTYTGKAGYSNTAGTQTTIDGGIITTDTLKVQRIQLGEKIVDQRTGETIGSGVTLASDGGFTAAGGNFKVTGGTTGSKGSIKNVVGDATNGKTAFETNQQGANMSFEKGGIKSEVAVADDSAKISAGASSIEVKNDGITNNGVTTFNGTTGTTTKIDGGTITTNHLITDKLTITGSGNADGTGSTTGSIAFGGNGSITSNIKDAATGKEATFKTDEKGTFTEAKDNDGNKTTNTVNAKGNTNVVTDSTNTSTATQTATSIGGVVTNGTVTMRQELTADGVKVSVDGDTANYTQITNKDVSINDQKNPGKRINLSDLGQLNDLDGELTARDEYQDNKTAVGAINAEAGIRREEVARLDNRINDVNDRVNKVGAMAAAIASLKSIGYDPQAPSEFSIGLGQYKGETGVAMGFFHYPNKNFMINVSLSTAGGETMGGIGATWRFGHKSPQKLLEEQREAQAKKELAAAEKYQAAAKLAKEAQERAEYAAKLARQAQVSADNAKAAADATQAKHFG